MGRGALFCLLPGDGVGLVTAEDQYLSVTEEFMLVVIAVIYYLI